jgi:hypothetical protein
MEPVYSQETNRTQEEYSDIPITPRFLTATTLYCLILIGAAVGGTYLGLQSRPQEALSTEEELPTKREFLNPNSVEDKTITLPDGREAVLKLREDPQ